MDALEKRTDRLEHLVERLSDRTDRNSEKNLALREEMLKGFESLRRSQQRWFWAVIVPLTVVAAGSFFR